MEQLFKEVQGYMFLTAQTADGNTNGNVERYMETAYISTLTATQACS